MPQPPIITLLTDFGLSDHYVAAMKGVILTRCPDTRLIDISHEVRPYGIAEAAFILGQAYSCFPPGSIHMVVVDPGVGSARRPLLLEADGHRFVGPDNGVLTLPMDRDARHTVREITATSWFRQPVSRTFHGRDIFAPVAAHLASGVASERFGTLVLNPVRLNLSPAVRIDEKVWQGLTLYIDRFGNLVTNLCLTDIADIASEPFEIAIGTAIVSRYHECYSEAQEGVLFALPGSSGYLEISINQGDAALAAGAATGSTTTLRFL